MYLSFIHSTSKCCYLKYGIFSNMLMSILILQIFKLIIIILQILKKTVNQINVIDLRYELKPQSIIQYILTASLNTFQFLKLFSIFPCKLYFIRQFKLNTRFLVFSFYVMPSYWRYPRHKAKTLFYILFLFQWPVLQTRACWRASFAVSPEFFRPIVFKRSG